MQLPVPKTANPKLQDAAFFQELEIRRTRALVEQDIDVLEELHSSEYQLITPSGRVFERDHYLSAIMQAPFYSKWQIEDFTSRIVSNMAAARYKATLSFPSGKVATCWHTGIYESISGTWKAVWSQATEITA